MNRALFVLAVAAVLCGLPSSTRAQTGVSSDRVSLPDGPGSLEGVGDNVSVNTNMALMSYSVPIQVPAGHAGMTPELALGYSSGGGSGTVGIGWSLDLPFIERMTSRGVPNYTSDDLFAADGSVELVRLPGTSPAVYRAKEEGGYVRFTFHEAAPGADYWTAEYPDGRVGYFGADSAGAVVPASRLEGAKGTFRYGLVEMKDPFGHALRYGYNRFAGNVPLVERIAWAHDSAGTARFSVKLDYESRQDLLSDAKPGFDALLQYRLASVTVYSGAQVLRSYALSYEDYSASGGLSRLKKVEQSGVGGVKNPIAFSFAYNQSLGATCSGASCQSPYLVSMGSLGSGMAAGQATLIDLNGDSLPDVVDASQTGAHQIRFNHLASDGTHTFSGATSSALGTQGGYALGSKSVQVLDVNGDGFADLVSTKNQKALLNLGAGDWSQEVLLTGSMGPDLEGFDADETADGVGTIRFIDFDNDRRIDILQTLDAATTNLFRNTGSGFVQLTGVDPIGWSFASDELDLADMNGDGLLDPVVVRENQVSYRLNFGDGSWGPQVDISGLDIPLANVKLAQLEDINGDSLADIVVVVGNEVKYALNRNGDSFQPMQTIAQAGGQSLPERVAGMTVLFADMNGNGSDDVVWIDSSGNVTYLELFPLKPNLISRIENGIGLVLEMTYSTSVLEAARDDEAGSPWAHKLPNPMVVLSQTDSYDLLNQVHEVTSYRYHEAFYDGALKQYRGYARVEAATEEEESQEAGLTVETFELGEADAYRHGLQLTVDTFSAGEPLTSVANTYEDCPLDVPETDPAVRAVCKTKVVTVHKERQAEAKWVTTEERTTYDAYGNEILEENLGVVSVGGGACEACATTELMGTPCGAQCLGDERFTETTYVAPTQTGGRWLLRAPATKKTSGKQGSQIYVEERYHYDGEAFVGLPVGQLTLGLLSRTEERTTANPETFIDSARNRFDAHGNEVEVLDALGSEGGETHRTLIGYDALGLKIVSVEQRLTDAAGAAYQLRREYAYDPLFDKVSEATDWMLVKGGTTQTARNSRFFTYDALGRLASTVLAGGDTVASPTEAYTWELGNPSSRVVIQRRSKPGAAFDQEEIRCQDGFGRTYQIRTRLDAGKYQVSGHTVFNRRGAAVKSYQAWVAADGTCDAAPKADTLFTAQRYDAAQRVLETTHPDAAERGGVASTTRHEYLPLGGRTYDEGDTGVALGAGTPTTAMSNGLGLRVREERLETAGGTPLVTSLRYDELGNLAAVVDPAGNAKTQEWDLRGRLLEVASPDEGTATMEYDALDKLVRATDARGVTVLRTWDGQSRPLTIAEEGKGELVRFTYDQAGAGCDTARCSNLPGRLSRVEFAALDGTGVDDFGYDVQGHSRYAGRTLGGFRFDRETTYDTLGRVLARSYPKSRTVTFSYDGASRLASVANVAALTWDDRGLLSAVDYASGSRSTWTWDAREALEATRTTGAGGASVVDLAYTLDRKQRVTAVADAVAASGASLNASFGFDNLDRLTSASLDAGRAAAEALELRYDAIENITRQASSVAGSAANLGDYQIGQGAGPHAVTGAGSLAFTYDAAGFVTGRGGDSNQWDALGRLVGVTRQGAPVARFAYTATAERSAKVEGDSTTWYPFPDYEVRDGVSSIVIDLPLGNRVRQEAADLAADLLSDLAPATLSGTAATPNPDGQITAADAWISQASSAGTLQLAAGSKAPSPVGSLLMACARRLLVESGSAVTFVHVDRLGTTVATTDSSGAPGLRAAHYPYGASRFSEGGAAEDDLFTGKERDEATGLVYFGARYLDPVVGRWTSPDPLFRILGAQAFGRLPEATSVYAYAGNDPVGTVDEEGTEKTKASKKGYWAKRQEKKEAKKAAQAAKKAAKKAAKDSASQRASSSRFLPKSVAGNDGGYHAPGWRDNHSEFFQLPTLPQQGSSGYYAPGWRGSDPDFVRLPVLTQPSASTASSRTPPQLPPARQPPPLPPPRTPNAPAQPGSSRVMGQRDPSVFAVLPSFASTSLPSNADYDEAKEWVTLPVLSNH